MWVTSVLSWIRWLDLFSTGIRKSRVLELPRIRQSASPELIISIANWIELSPPEPYTVTEDSILVDLEQVSDGHLHRFEYTTANKISVRWIVVKKPNDGAYGVGLDACDVCGNAGYYERGSQVVCKRCDVVMNINTIGFKGGCNPIPLAYTIEDGRMVFRLEDIIAGEAEFKF